MNQETVAKGEGTALSGAAKSGEFGTDRHVPSVPPRAPVRFAAKPLTAAPPLPGCDANAGPLPTSRLTPGLMPGSDCMGIDAVGDIRGAKCATVCGVENTVLWRNLRVLISMVAVSLGVTMVGSSHSTGVSSRAVAVAAASTTCGVRTRGNSACLQMGNECSWSARSRRLVWHAVIVDQLLSSPGIRMGCLDVG